MCEEDHQQSSAIGTKQEVGHTARCSGAEIGASEPWVALDLWDAGVVPKKLSERDLVPAFRRIRQIFAAGIFNAKFGVLLQQKYKRCGELLCQGANLEFRVRIIGDILF